MNRPALLNILCVFFLFSCHQTNTRIHNLNENKISVIGHGGSGFNSWLNTLPINSFESIQQAVEDKNADGVEMDVQLSADNKLILFHDELLETATDCSGLVNLHPETELTRCTYSSVGTKNFHVVSLNKIIQHFSEASTPPFLTFDLKAYPGKPTEVDEYTRNFARAVSEIADSYCCPEKILIESTSKELLLEMKSINPNLQLFIYQADFESGFATAKEMVLFGITIRHDLISKEQVDLAHQNGLRVTIWGTKSKKSNKEAIHKNPDYIQTDNIKSLISLLN